MKVEFRYGKGASDLSKDRKSEFLDDTGFEVLDDRNYETGFDPDQIKFGLSVMGNSPFKFFMANQENHNDRVSIIRDDYETLFMLMPLSKEW